MEVHTMRNTVVMLVFYVFMLFEAFPIVITAQMMQKESTKYVVDIKSIQDSPEPIYDKTITFQVFSKTLDIEKEITFETQAHKILDFYPMEGEHILLHGELGWGGDVFTLVDIKKSSVVDVIFGWDAAISPDMTKIVYNFRYPPAAPPLYRTSTLLMYDLAKSPEENSMDGSYDNPENRGFILWPEENRQQRRYFIPATTFEEQRHIISPIVWNKDSSKVCFLLHFGDLEAREKPSSLAVVDISDGLLKPVISVQEIDPTPLYKARVLERTPEKDRNKMIPATELRFVKDDRAVAIKAYDSSFFDGQKTVIVDIQH
jgi:hypothetical protein